MGELELPLQDNPHLAEMAVCVVPGHRRRGIGRRLFGALEELRRAERRTTVIGELVVTDEPKGRAGMEFATALGFGSVHVEDHLLLPLPVGELDLEPTVMGEARRRTQEERMARRTTRSWPPTAARRVVDGVMGGYSILFLAHDDAEAIQDDTLVMPEHRGRRLGTLLKLATLDVLVCEHPQRRNLHTWTDPENHAMYRTNLAFGYTAVERMHEVQRRDDE